MKLVKLRKYLKKQYKRNKFQSYNNLIQKRKLIRLSKNNYKLMKGQTYFERQKIYNLKYFNNYYLNVKRIFKLYYPNIKSKILNKYLQKSKNYSYFYRKSFLNFLTTRLDSIIFATGFVKTHNEVKQLIKYGHVLINNKKITSLNYLVKKYDIITLNSKFWNKKKSKKYFFGKIYRNKVIGLNIYFIRDLITSSIIFLGFKNFNKGRVKSHKNWLNSLNHLFMKVYK